MWHISRLNKDWLWLGILITITIFYFIFYFIVDTDIWRFEKSHISAVFPSERNRFVKCRHLWILTSLKIIVLLQIDLSQPTNSDQVSWLLFVPIQTQGSSTWQSAYATATLIPCSSVFFPLLNSFIGCYQWHYQYTGKYPIVQLIYHRYMKHSNGM